MVTSQERRNREAAEAAHRHAEACRQWFPALTLRIHAVPTGVRVEAYLFTGGRDGDPRRESIAYVTFRPPEVSENLVVQWGIGALSTWLQGKAEAAAEAVVDLPQ